MKLALPPPTKTATGAETVLGLVTPAGPKAISADPETSRAVVCPRFWTTITTVTWSPVPTVAGLATKLLMLITAGAWIVTEEEVDALLLMAAREAASVPVALPPKVRLPVPTAE